MNTSFDKRATSIVKGVAILFMLIHHSYLDPTRYTGYTVDFFPFTEENVNLVANFFKTCVGIFAFISGYGITLSMKKVEKNYQLTRQQTMEVTIHRYLSMMSGYWFIFVLSCMIPFPATIKRLSEIYGTDGLSILHIIIDFLGLSHILDSPMNCGTWWYMSLAILIVIFMPILLRFYNKYSFLTLFALLLVPRAIKMEMNDVIRWFPVVLLGIFCADLDLLVKLKQFRITKNFLISKALKLLLCSLLLVFFIRARKMDPIRGFYEIWDGVVPAFVVYVIFEFIVGIKGLNTILAFLGKHSMNMFLTHTLLRQTYYKAFFYSFHNAWLNVLVLLLASLLLSLAIEWLKKLTHYNALMGHLTTKATSLANYL